MLPANSNGGASKRKRRRSSPPRLTATQARTAVEQLARMDRVAVDCGLSVEEIEQSKGYALIVTQAAYDALARSNPLAIVRVLHDFFVPFATALPDFYMPIGVNGPVGNDGVKISLAVLDAIADRRPTPYNPDWVWDGQDPSWLHVALQFSVLAAQKAGRPHVFRRRLANLLVTVTGQLVSGAGVRAARRLVAALDAAGCERDEGGAARSRSNAASGIVGPAAKAPTAPPRSHVMALSSRALH